MRSIRLITIAITISLLTVSYLPILSLGGTPAPILASRSTLTDHDTILIQSDSEFNASNGVVSGDGSLSNPYIIENWLINASQENGIQIQNTDSYFIIRNCSIWTPRWYSRNGVLLDTVSNGTLRNLSISYNSDGLSIDSSKDLVVENVTFYSNSNEGIQIGNSNNLTFRNISIDEFSHYAIYIDTAADIFFENFFVQNRGQGSLYIRTCERCQFLKGWINGSKGDGVYLVDSEEILFSNITITNSTLYGLKISELKNSTIKDNKISNSGYQGLFLSYQNDRLKVINNVVFNNSVGLDLYEVTNSYFLGNTAHDNQFAGMILSSGSKNDTFFENKMANNPYNFGIDNWHEYPKSLDHRISNNNTVDGKPIYFWTGVSDRTVPLDAGYVGLVNCDNITIYGLNLSHLLQGAIVNSSRDITVRDCIFSHDYDVMDLQNSTVDIFNNSLSGGQDEFGLIMDHMTNSKIKNNTFKSLSIGIQLSDSEDIIISDNSFFNLIYLFYRGWTSYALTILSAKNVTIANNTMINCSQDAIKLFQSTSTFIGGNEIDKCRYAITISASSKSSIAGNDIGNCKDAITLSGSTNSSIDGNEIDYCTYAIGIYLSDTNITGNNLSNGKYGIYISPNSIINRIQDNGLQNITTGILSYYFHGALIFNNIFYKNHNAIKLVSECSENTFANNLFLNNTQGIGIVDTVYSVKNNVFYNNFFNDTTDVNPGLYGNQWNITKQPGRSIAGGLYLGGNYWSNYTGQDLDGDYLGDTMIPYGHKDFHPLILAPAILDLTNSTPVTGSPFTLNASLMFREGLGEFTVEYWFDNGSHNRTPMVLSDGKISDGNYSLKIEVPMDAGTLHYFFKAISAKGQLSITTVRDLDVLDIFAPTIENLGGSPSTGDNYTFEIDFQDNRGFSNRTVDYWFDSGNRTRLDSSNISKTLVIRLDAHVLHFIANATDLSNNTASLEETIQVLDNKPPTIVIISGRPGTGEQYRFRCNITDNWAVGNVSMDYWFDGAKTHTGLTFMNGVYWADLIPPLNSTVLHYSIRAVDGSGNLVWSNGSQVVRDTIPPAIVDLSGVPSMGDLFEVKAEFSDIIDKGVSSGILDYSFDSGAPMRVNFPGSFKVQVPDGARRMNYTIRCIDRGGNPMSLDRNVSVLDNDPPSLVDHSRGRPAAGQSYLLNVSAHDNIGLKAVYAEYWFEGQKKRVDLNEQKGFYLAIVLVPKGAEKLHYIILAEDTFGNKASLPQKTLGLSTQTNYTSPCIMIGLILVAVAVIIVVATYSYQRHKLEKKPQEPPSDDEEMEMDDGPSEEE